MAGIRRGSTGFITQAGVNLRLNGTIFGEMAGPTLIHGQRVVPRRALDLGFTFVRPELEEGVR